jgi:2-keto-4-pentenoate hydratase/2-oxohepta-3-ene-1,7-dioic acid hydratase in catechol pathway
LAGFSLPVRGDKAPPVDPGKIVAVGLNYRPHIHEMGHALPGEPLLFLKAVSALVPAGAPIVIPRESSRVEHEGELAVVIGKRCRRVSPAEAPGFILGYTIANDVTARDLQKRDGQWARAKSFDTFCPLGPWVDTEADPADLLLTVTVTGPARPPGGELRQRARTSEMLFAPAELVAHVSSVMTLLPGDVILTGTPGGVGPLLAGDTVSVTIEGIGTLTSPVEAERP